MSHAGICRNMPERIRILRDKDLNERQINTVKYLEQNEDIKRKDYCDLFGIGKSVAFEELDEMVEKGIIERKGKGRGTHYILRTKRTKTGRKPDNS